MHLGLTCHFISKLLWYLLLQLSKMIWVFTHTHAEYCYKHHCPSLSLQVWYLLLSIPLLDSSLLITTALSPCRRKSPLFCTLSPSSAFWQSWQRGTKLVTVSLPASLRTLCGGPIPHFYPVQINYFPVKLVRPGEWYQPKSPGELRSSACALRARKTPESSDTSFSAASTTCLWACFMGPLSGHSGPASCDSIEVTAASNFGKVANGSGTSCEEFWHFMYQLSAGSSLRLYSLSELHTQEYAHGVRHVV